MEYTEYERKITPEEEFSFCVGCHVADIKFNVHAVMDYAKTDKAKNILSQINELVGELTDDDFFFVEKEYNKAHDITTTECDEDIPF